MLLGVFLLAAPVVVICFGVLLGLIAKRRAIERDQTEAGRSKE